MVLHWWRDRKNNLRWLPKAIINGLGALATFATLLIVGISKFREGAWIIVLLIPIFVIAFRRIQQHYQDVGKQLSLRGLPPDLKPLPPLRLVIPVSGVHRGIIEAMDFALSISKHVTGVYIELEPGAGEQSAQGMEMLVAGCAPGYPALTLPLDHPPAARLPG